MPFSKILLNWENMIIIIDDDNDDEKGGEHDRAWQG